MYVYTVCRSSQAEPKSMILMIGLSRLRHVNYWCTLDSGVHQLLQQDVLRLQVAVYQACFAQKAQSIQKLLCEYSHKSCAKSPELVLLDQLVKID